MADSLSSPGIDPPSPTLSARLRELADYLAAPLAGRLTEEQRALSLGIARRLVGDAAAALDKSIDVPSLWNEWLDGGLPTASRLSPACFARAEEHRWREYSAIRTLAPVALSESDEEEGAAVPAAADGAESTTAANRAYLALQIADRRRFDRHGHPCITIADIDADPLRALLRDIAAWQTMRSGPDGMAVSPNDMVERALDRRMLPESLDRAAANYHAALTSAEVAQTAATAIARHDWLALIALAAAGNRRTYSDMALALVSAEPAALPALLAPLRVDRSSLAPIEASLAALPDRAGESVR